MCKWKENGVIGLIVGCLASACFLTTFLFCFINNSHVPIDRILSIVVEDMSTKVNNKNENKNKIATPKNQISPSSIQEKFSSPKENSTLSAIISLICIWFFGIFFSTFSRALAEKVRDGINSNSLPRH